MIKTKSIYDQVNGDDGYRFLVSRYYPRGIRKELSQFEAWYRELAPSSLLLKAYKNNLLNWEGFARHYKIEMLKDSSQKLIRHLYDLSKIAQVTLLCYENERQNCHRTILKEIIESYGDQI